MDMYTVNKTQVGSQAAFAGKPAPTVDRVQPREIGRLSGRHRWQASSYSGSSAATRDGLAVRPPSLASQLPQWIEYSHAGKADRRTAGSYKSKHVRLQKNPARNSPGRIYRTVQPHTIQATGINGSAAAQALSRSAAGG